MDRPVIGMCTAWERARWGLWDDAAALLPRNYIDAAYRAGGLAILLPPDPALAEQPDDALDLIDGLLLAGGADIDPGVYNAERHPETPDTVPERDRFEIALARGALARDLPVLGICRGMQLMNIARGGTLPPHLPEELRQEDPRRAPATFDGSAHDVRLAEGSLAARCAGELLHKTKSHHHQGVERIGD